MIGRQNLQDRTFLLWRNFTSISRFADRIGRGRLHGSGFPLNS
jgi:hypothetical protein